MLVTSRNPVTAVSSEDLEGLVHELRVHQVELELQNEELRQAEFDLAKVREEQARLFDLAPVPLLILAPDSRVERANLAAETLLKTAQEQLPGRTLASFAGPGDPPAIHRHFRTVFASNAEHVCELPLAKADGEIFEAELRSRLASEGGEDRCITILLDRSKRKQDERYRKQVELLHSGRAQILEQIARNEDLPSILASLATTIEGLLPGTLASVLLLDAEHACLRVGAGPSLPDFYNEAIDGFAIGPAAGSCGTAAYTGRRVVAADVLTDPLWAPYRELTREVGFRACWSEPVRGLEGTVLGTFAIYHRDPHEPSATELAVIEVGAQLASVAIEHRRAQDALVEVNASLERRVAERTRELKASNRALRRANDELERFASIASHDLREPVRAIRGFAERLQTNYGDTLDERASRYLKHILDGSARMRTMIQTLLQDSRIGQESDPPCAVDLDQVMSQVLASLQPSIEESGARIECDLLPTVPGNAVQLQQLFQNLLTNAIKFHREDQPPQVRIQAERRDAKWLVEVVDQGVGIPPGQQKAIFQFSHRPRESRDVPGRGMGLAICHRVVQRHGGRIWVESKPGQGSTFFFTLAAGKD